MGDGIGGSIVAFLSNNAFELLITHHRKDNAEEYGKTEKIISRRWRCVSFCEWGGEQKPAVVGPSRQVRVAWATKNQRGACVRRAIAT